MHTVGYDPSHPVLLATIGRYSLGSRIPTNSSATSQSLIITDSPSPASPPAPPR